MLIQVIVTGAGLLLSQFLGSFSECFLTKSVTVTQQVPRNLLAGQTGGGGKQLGTLERLLFFASFWMGAYAVAGGWLAFKVAAKWASWQHIAKLAEGEAKFEDRILLSSHLLGRFLNGTLYNAFCAAAGVVLAKFIHFSLGELLNKSIGWLLWLLASIGVTVVIVWIGSSLFPKNRKGPHTVGRNLK